MREPATKLTKSTKSTKSIKTSQKPIKKFCPDCRRVPLTRHRNFYSCPTCGGELWDGHWFAGRGQEDVKVYIDMMQAQWTIKGRRSSKSGRRRRRQSIQRPARSWLDSYY